MTVPWLIDFFAEKSNQYLGSIICEYVYVLELPMSWQSGIRMVPNHHIKPGELRKLVDSVE